MHIEQPGGRLGESVGAEDLRADVAVQADEIKCRFGANKRDEPRSIGEHDAEFLVFVGGGQKIVGVRVHAAVHAQAHVLHPTVSSGGFGDTADFDLAVDHDRADTDPGGLIEFGE